MEDLKSLNDSIGEETNIHGSFSVDTINRDSPFVYIDGEIVLGDKGSSHTQTINEWCENNNIEPMEEKWLRQSNETISKTINKDIVGFGHIVNNIAIIETLINCGADKVLSALKASGDYKKIYELIYELITEDYYIKRLAKK